jgi:hypothetical protein
VRKIEAPAAGAVNTVFRTESQFTTTVNEMNPYLWTAQPSNTGRQERRRIAGPMWVNYGLQ